MTIERIAPPNPYDHLPKRPPMSVRSDDFAEGEALALTFAHGSAGGDNVSPHLAWSGEPDGTQSFAVTCFDPDAPTGSGWWHWLVLDLPADVHELPRDVSRNDLPTPAIELRTDYGTSGYQGSSPPPGDMPHRYIFAVHAIDVPTLGLSPDTPAAMASANITFHSLARGIITAWYSH